MIELTANEIEALHQLFVNSLLLSFFISSKCEIKIYNIKNVISVIAE